MPCFSIPFFWGGARTIKCGPPIREDRTACYDYRLIAVSRTTLRLDAGWCEVMELTLSLTLDNGAIQLFWTYFIRFFVFVNGMRLDRLHEMYRPCLVNGNTPGGAGFYLILSPCTAPKGGQAPTQPLAQPTSTHVSSHAFQPLRYSTCSDVRASMESPRAASFTRPIWSSISSGTL